MESTEITSIIIIIVQLIFLEGLLSIDNAAVLAAMVSPLPDDQPVPYPDALQFLQPWTQRFLGMQQLAALKVGLLVAYLGRGLMLFIASWVIENPILKIVGALYLIKLALDHLAGDHETEVVASEPVSAATTFWIVVLNVELADLIFSLDNVVVAVALSKDIWVVMAGVALGIITMRFAAGIFTQMIKREPILVTAAYLIVLTIGTELLISEFFHREFPAWLRFTISMGVILLCVFYAHSPLFQATEPLWRGLRRIIGGFKQLINRITALCLFPLKWFFHLLTRPKSASPSQGDDPSA